MQALWINPGYPEFIPGINFSLTNKNLFTISIILYFQKKILLNAGILPKVVFNPKLLNNPLATCSLINLDLLLSYPALDFICLFL